jgi:hypothetical protein
MQRSPTVGTEDDDDDDDDDEDEDEHDESRDMVYDPPSLGGYGAPGKVADRPSLGSFGPASKVEDKVCGMGWNGQNLIFFDMWAN